MKTATSIKLDQEVKQEAAKLADELGLSLSSVINATLKQFINERRVVFSVEPEFNTASANTMRTLRADVADKKNLSDSFESVDELRESLNA